MRLRAWLSPTLLAAGLSACATLPPPLPEAADCRANYLGFDQKVEAAEARNGGARVIPGFPYLRSDRFLASFRDEVGDEDAKFEAWVEHLRQLDLQARRSELRNVGWPDPTEELSHLDRCSRAWAERDLRDPARRAALREQAAVPDDYSLLRRTLGLYPAAVPFLNLGIGDFNEETLADYAKPLPLLDVPGRPVLYEPAGAAHGRGFLLPRRDALGIPQIKPEQWQRLARAHAPAWQVEDDGSFDRIGAPVLKDGAPTVDPSRPVTYFQPAYTRFAGKVLPQLVYTVWFSERPKSGVIDSYAGALDGVVWRVTLDDDGQPLLYDTIHPCGCYHFYYLAKPLKRKPQGGFWDEPVLFPQTAPPQPFAVRIQSRTHYVRRLVPLQQADAAEKKPYAIGDYGELLSLPDGKGGTRSLFCEDGLACGTERFERFWLVSAGIKSAGAMRQWGRHATSFVGRSHFDDPGMMDRLFEAP
jgi:hypothetical protein